MDRTTHTRLSLDKHNLLCSSALSPWSLTDLTLGRYFVQPLSIESAALCENLDDDCATRSELHSLAQGLKKHSSDSSWLNTWQSELVDVLLRTNPVGKIYKGP